MVEIIKEDHDPNKETLMQELECPQIIFFDGSVTLQITASDVAVVEKLSNNQEDADMTLLLHAAHALSENAMGSVLVRSPPEEVDINLLLLDVLYENPEKMVVEISGRFGSSINFNEEHDQALVDFYSFTGDDHISSYF